MVKKEVSRRDFVKATAVTLAVAAAGGTMATAVGCTNQGAGGGSSKAETKTFTSVCRFCGCGCGVLCEVDVANNKLVSVTGDPDNESNKGLNCVKGYYLAKVLYGDDRLTKPLIRKDKSTKGTKDGLTEATWEEAIDLVASKLKEQWKADKKAIAFWASGQQPIVEGYLLAKFWKAGLLSNMIDPNARLCMASAVVAFMNVFGTDEPAGSYSDIEETDVFVTWGANMAEAHPMLYSRVVARKLADSKVKHYDLGTITTRTSVSADKVLIFRPGSDNAIACAIANYLVTNNKVDTDFIAKNVIFQQGTENLSNPYEDNYDASPIGQTGGAVKVITFDEYKARLAEYTLEKAAEISGVSVSDIRALADEFADPAKKILSLWTMGVNQHNRGVWMNHNIYNLHLLTGKIAKPGCGPFSLTGQPTAC
ncbi:MAG TPA: periplasmic nitrate reductase subunit alpha, partial [Coriobacteriia bacterium]|nr:periplasmic nitrate reductase subunit alpha [Coriobacteriia bacterium]